MRRPLGGILGGLLLLLVAGGDAGVYCQPPAPKDCCGKQRNPGAPKTPCAQMACCKVALPQAAVTAAPLVRFVAYTLPDLPLPAVSAAHERVASTPECGPPQRPQESHSGRSPPAALLG